MAVRLWRRLLLLLLRGAVVASLTRPWYLSHAWACCCTSP
jgi:hypothetical protein